MEEGYIRGLDKLRTETLNDAYDVRVMANNQFFEDLEDSKVDLTIAKEQGMIELRDFSDRMVEELRGRGKAIREETKAEMQEDAEEVCRETYEKLCDASATGTLS